MIKAPPKKEMTYSNVAIKILKPRYRFNDTRLVFHGLIVFLLYLNCSLSLGDINAIYYDQNGTQREYFTGTQVQQIDSNINFNWGTGSPTGGIGNNDFTVRWIGEVEVPTSGDYTFTTNSDDGVRLSINGLQIIDNWTDHAPTENSATVTGLISGQRYPVLMEMYERGGGAVAMLYWTGPGISKQIIPSGNLFIDSSAPNVSSVISPCLGGEISVYYSEPVSSISATNLANYSADGGVILKSATIDATNQVVTIAYFGGSGSSFNLTVSNISDLVGNTMAVPSVNNVSNIANGLLGSYFDQNNTSRQYFTGNKTERIDSTVNFSWGTGAPFSGIGANRFSVRWEGEIEAPSTGSYLFYTVSDDGVRLDLNGIRIIDNWTDHAATTDTSSVQSLTANTRYPITMEFYEQGGHATARLLWSGPGIAQQVVPFDRLFATCPTASASLVAEWNLDEATWSGVANEVIDTTSNALHGQAINLDALPSKSASDPALPGDPGTCAYGLFDGTNDGYIQINDPGGNSALDFDNEYSISAWVYPRSFPSSGLGTILSKNENYEFHINSAGQIYWWWGGGDRELTSTGSITLNSWNHIAITYKPGEQVIYINGATSATNTSVTALTVNNDDIYIGSDIGFPTRRIDALLDEVKIYNSALSATLVNSVMNETHGCPISPVDHYAISHTGTGVTCEAENITISAHDASELSTNVAGDTIRITATSNTVGWDASNSQWVLDSGTGNLSTPSDGVAEYTFGSGENSVTLAFSNPTEALIDFDVVDTSNSSLGENDGGAEDPSLNFTNTAFRFYNDVNTDGNADDTTAISSPQIAGVNSTQIILRGIETDSETGACIPRIQGAQNVQLAYECVNPTSCIRDKDLSLLSGPVEENNLNTIVDYSTHNLTFDAEGEAPLIYNYQDVGNIRLHALLNLPATGNEAAYSLSGTSAVVTVKPNNLAITDIESLAGVDNPSTTTTGAGFVAAGEAFSVTVQAQNANGDITPNFGKESASENIILNAVSLSMPAGGNLASLNAASSFSPTVTDGEFANNSVNWPEVGTIILNATIADGDYLGSGDVAGTNSTNVGRFYAANFILISSSLTQGCAAGGFTYMSDTTVNHRPIDTDFTVMAVSSNGGTLQNYDSSLSYPVDSFVGVAEDGNNGVDLASRIFMPSGTWIAGQMLVSGNDNTGFGRLLVGANITPDGPFTNLQFGIKPSGSGVDSTNFNSASLNMRAGASNNCVIDGNCDAISIGNAANIRFGRLFAKDAHGPETAPLPVSIFTQYWNGTAFEKNDDDSCTTINASDISFDSNDLSTDANRTVTLGSGTTTGIFSNINPGISISFIAGDANLSFTAAGSGNTGSFPIDFNLTNYAWLRSDWDQNSDYNNDTALPSITINFGSYRGHDRVIQWQEVFTD